MNPPHAAPGAPHTLPGGLAPDELAILAARFAPSEAAAVALMGSHARGDAGPYSDVDIVRFLPGPGALPDDGTHYLAGRLVVAGSVTPEQVEHWFSHPEEASKSIAGLRAALSLIDRDGRLAALIARACAFRWDAEMQTRADAWAAEQMVGWIEEMHKLLEGLRRGEVGRLLNGLHGGTWGMASVMQVQRGVLLSGDNGFYDAVRDAVGKETLWSRLLAEAFGARGESSLSRRAVVGLRLYVETARLLDDALPPQPRALVRQAVDIIKTELLHRAEG